MFLFRQQGMELDLKRTDHFTLLVRVLFGFPLESIKRINLSNNRLRSLQAMQTLVPKMPAVEWLKLSYNLLHKWDDLEHVKAWPIKGM